MNLSFFSFQHASLFAFLFLICWSGTPLVAQDHDSTLQQKTWTGRTFDKIFGDSHEPEKPKLLAYPTIGYAPETNLEIGISALGLFYAKNDHINNRLSEVKLFSFFTLEQQYGLWLEHSIYGDRDKWFFLGAIRQQRFPLLYYGIGPETNGEDPIDIQADYTLIRERVLRKVSNNLFLGLEIDLQNLYRVEFDRPAFPEPRGAAGSFNLGLGLGLVYDSRHNVLNERDGLFAEIAYLNYNKTWGSAFNFRGIYWDVRKFIPVSPDKKQVLAIQAAGAFMSGDVPFNQMALLGGEVLMRGYYLGRYRDNSYAAAQVEYRILPFPFSKRFGAAAFLSAGAVAPRPGAFNLSQFKPAGGVGLRWLLFPQKDIYVRFDVGITEEGTGIYFFTGESF